jgi:transcriptional regulator with XRE-family HTH domain
MGTLSPRKQELNFGDGSLQPCGTIIGKQISSARAQRNLTRRDLGALLGISSEEVEQYEAGVEAMPAGMLYRLSQVFDLPVTAFFRQPD